MFPAAQALINAWPDFPPSLVFQEFYQAHCFTAICGYTSQVSTQNMFVASVRDEFEQLQSTIVADCKRCSASDIHRSRLRAIHAQLAVLKSHRTCFCCLMRMPEKVLTCGHALCDICIKIFGVRSHSEKYTYSLSLCLLCGAGNHRPDFQMMPPTAGPRVLSLDGGGIRGVIPLVFLEHIQQQMAELDCPLRDYLTSSVAHPLV